MTQHETKQVLLAMSGGIDSSTAAKILVDEGYEVCGLTLGLDPSGYAPYPTSEAQEARNLCDKLGIPHEYRDFSSLFTEKVIQPFCNEYIAGHTPNPCVICNPAVKFTALEQVRIELDFDMIATGHYARICQDNITKRWKLFRALDTKKDQSYFLYGLSQDILNHCLFPLGTWEKSEVKSFANRHNLLSESKKESQDVCFISQGGYADFIAAHSKDIADAFKEGPIVNSTGKRLGTHRGLVHYTYGQRKGIGVAGSEPYYVIHKNIPQNTLTIGTKNELNAMVGLHIDSVNCIQGEPLKGITKVQVKCHYRQNPQPATLSWLGFDHCYLEFENPLPLVAVGQSVVCYQGDEVVCGGIASLSIA